MRRGAERRLPGTKGIYLRDASRQGDGLVADSDDARLAVQYHGRILLVLDLPGSSRPPSWPVSSCPTRDARVSR